MKRMMRCLQKVVVDEEARKQMALEDELVGMLRRSEQALEREQIERQAKEAALAEAEHQRSVAERERAEKDRERTEKEKERTEKEKERAEKDAALAELEKLRAENARLRGSE
jgi:penicillin-binding protein 2A